MPIYPKDFKFGQGPTAHQAPVVVTLSADLRSPEQIGRGSHALSLALATSIAIRESGIPTVDVAENLSTENRMPTRGGYHG